MIHRLIGIIVLVGVLVLSIWGLTSPEHSTYTLPPNQKLESVTSCSGNLHFTTRQMKPGEIAETHTFYKQDILGIISTITIIEQGGSQ